VLQKVERPLGFLGVVVSAGEDRDQLELRNNEDVLPSVAPSENREDLAPVVRKARAPPEIAVGLPSIELGVLAG